MVGHIHSYLTLPRIVKLSMRDDSKTAQHVAARVPAADDESSAASSLPASHVAAGARDITPHAQNDFEVWFIYYGRSDVSDSKKASEAPRSPRYLFLSLHQKLFRTNGLKTCFTVFSAVMKIIVVIIFTHHHSNLCVFAQACRRWREPSSLQKPWYKC